MILVGMLDSPYVRRVAVSMKLMGLPFEHQPYPTLVAYSQRAEALPEFASTPLD